MIKNLPPQFPIAALEEFDFGSAEARDDQLLAACPVSTSAMLGLLSGSKDIVLGYRGTGKSALVRLLAERKVSFKTPDASAAIVLCLDEEFDYRAIRENLHKRAVDERSQTLMCRVVWELLLIYRALQMVQAHFGDNDSTLREYIKDIDVLLGISTRSPGLFEIILSHKKKVGVKLDTNLPHIVDMYAGLEPASEPATNSIAEPTILKLAEYKRYVDKYLAQRKTVLYVLFDRLDDFVVQEDYDTQKKLLQGLLATQLNYREKCQNIKVKAFLRTDLFQRLDLNEFGPDKVLARTVELVWSPSEIKHFLAKRIAHNLLNALKLWRLEVTVEADTLLVTREELPRLEETKLTLQNFDVWSVDHWKRFWWFLSVRRRGKDDEGRSRSARDALNEAVITSVFPRSITDPMKPTATTALIDFIESHFLLAHGHCTPRGLLSFLNRTLDAARRYYEHNSDIRYVACDERYEYPLFVKPAVQDAYRTYRKEAWEVQYHWAKDNKPLVAELEKLAIRRNFSFAEFCRVSGVPSDTARQFLVFATQTGLIRCVNERERIENRAYEFPLLFQVVPVVI